MCSYSFYITKEFQENPTHTQPIDNDITIKKSDEMVVFAKTFGGYAMKDSVWLTHEAAFREELAERAAEVEDGFFYTAGYDSPMKFWDRRNEVMVQKKSNEVDNDVLTNLNEFRQVLTDLNKN